LVVFSNILDTSQRPYIIKMRLFLCAFDAYVHAHNFLFYITMFYQFICHLFSQIQTTSHVGFNTIKAMIKYTISWFLFFKIKAI
jgi:hypothetical protein